MKKELREKAQDAEDPKRKKGRMIQRERYGGASP